MYAAALKPNKGQRSIAAANAITLKKDRGRHTAGSADNGKVGVASSSRVRKPIETVMQRNSYKAGVGNSWHVHYDHVKFDGDNSSRINTTKRTAKQVLDAMKLNTSWPWNIEGHVKCYKDCKKWIRENLP